jgi:glycosyltransferase involved in cell wall biosynthesis
MEVQATLLDDVNVKPFLISVITPCFNSEATIRETLQSVVDQDYPHWEHIVVDGASRDGTLGILKEFPRLRWKSERDQGHYHAMNKGIEMARGDAIVILNADDCFRPGVFRSVAEALTENPDWDGLFGDTIYVDGRGDEIFRRVEAKYDYDVLRFAMDNIVHHTLFVRPHVYQRLGAYRHQLFKNAADYDFMLRMGRGGMRIGKLPEFFINYRYHEFGQSIDLRIKANTQRESAVVQREHGKPDGMLGAAAFVYGHARRQFQKLVTRGTVDLMPGPLIMRRRMVSKAKFSSNAGLDTMSV